MRNFGISFLIPLALLLTTKAYADEREVSSEDADVSAPAELVQSCLEQAALGAPVSRHGVVVIEMVLTEVGEHRDVETDAVNPTLLEAVG